MAVAISLWEGKEKIDLVPTYMVVNMFSTKCKLCSSKFSSYESKAFSEG
jgi:hypothetical protein